MASGRVPKTSKYRTESLLQRDNGRRRLHGAAACNIRHEAPRFPALNGPPGVRREMRGGALRIGHRHRGTKEKKQETFHDFPKI